MNMPFRKEEIRRDSILQGNIMIHNKSLKTCTSCDLVILLTAIYPREIITHIAGIEVQ